MTEVEAEPGSGVLNYLHCGKCLQERPRAISPKDWSRTQTGVGRFGELIVWCNRHECLVAKVKVEDVALFLLNMAGVECPECGQGGHSH